MTEWGGIPMEYRDQIVTGDARELAARLPDSSVDLVFTDPPYPREFLPLYGWLAETAARVLRPGGLCVALAGHAGLPEVMREMAPHLRFYWIGGMLHTSGMTARCKRFLCGWKPMLWYSRGMPAPHSWIFDLFQPPTQDKRYHAWGQSASYAEYYVRKVTEHGAVVLEPFTGGGTVPAVCKQLGRHYVAFEIVPEVAAKARERVHNTPIPLLLPDDEQRPAPQPALFLESVP